MKVLPMAVACAAFAAALPSSSAAQTAERCVVDPALAAGRGTITGTVMDVHGAWVDNADILVETPRRRALASNGRFRFDSLPAGEYRLTAKRLGYLPQTRKVTVAERGGVIAFCLADAPRGLPAIVSSGKAGGLAGLVVDSASDRVPEAQVTISGPNGTVKVVSSDSGSFYAPLRPGSYLVTVKRPWFETKVVSVTIPEDSGRSIRIPLTTTSTPPSHWEAANAFDWHSTMINSVGLKMFTRETLDSLADWSTQQLTQSWAIGTMDDGCPLHVMNDGPEYSIPLYSADLSQFEMLSVIRAPLTPALESAPSKAPRSMSLRNESCSATVYGWLRK